MKYISNKEYAEYEKYLEEKRSGRLFNANTVRFICESCDYDPQKIGEYMLEILPKVCPLPDCFFDGLDTPDPELEEVKRKNAQMHPKKPKCTQETEMHPDNL